MSHINNEAGKAVRERKVMFNSQDEVEHREPKIEEEENENESKDNENEDEDGVRDYDDEEDEKAFMELFEREIKKREAAWKEAELKERERLLEEQRQAFLKELDARERVWREEEQRERARLLEEQKNMFLKVLSEKVGNASGTVKTKPSHKTIKLTIKNMYDRNPGKPLSLTDNSENLSITPIFNNSNGKKLKVKVKNDKNCVEKTYINPTSGLKIVLNDDKEG